jgi:hypothetical protein
VYTITGATTANFTVTAPSVATTITGNALITDDSVTINSVVQPGVILDGSSTLPALRITQTGTGDALLIDDDTNPDVTPFVVDTSGNVGIGVRTITSGVDLAVNAGPAATFDMYAYRANGTSETPTKLDSGDNIFILVANGYDGDKYLPAARILMDVNSATDTDDMPGRIIFATTPNGSDALVDRVTFDSEGRVGIGTTAPDTALEVSGGTTVAASGTASSISGTTLTVGGTVVSGFAVGQVIFGSGVEPNTYITALGSGSGGAGTYTVSISQTVSSTTISSISAQTNRIRITDTDTSAATNQPIGTLEFYGSDASTPGASVKAFIQAINETSSPDSALIFGTFDDGSTDTTASEKFRIKPSGLVFSKYSTLAQSIVPSQLYYRLDSNYVGNNSSLAQSLFGVGVPLAASTTYAFEMMFVLYKTAGTVSHSMSLLFDMSGSGTITAIDYSVLGTLKGNPVTVIAVPDVLLYSQTDGATQITASTTTAGINFIGVVKGTFSVGTAGTWEPQYKLSAAPGGAYSTLTGSYVSVYPLGGSGSNINIGGWV